MHTLTGTNGADAKTCAQLFLKSQKNVLSAALLKLFPFFNVHMQTKIKVKKLIQEISPSKMIYFEEIH